MVRMNRSCRSALSTKKSGISEPGNTACQSTEKDNAFITLLFPACRRVLIQH
jgi:hypothetical protein